MNERIRNIALTATLATGAVFAVGACDASAQPKDTSYSDNAPTIMQIRENPHNRIPEGAVLFVIGAIGLAVLAVGAVSE